MPSRDEEFDQWCARVNIGVMDSIFSGALEHARRFELETGLFLFVLYPAQAPSGLSHTAREMMFMKVAHDDTVVHLYSARNPGKYPTLHVVAPAEQFHTNAAAPPSSQSPSDRLRELAKQRVSSTLLCRVMPTRDGGYALIRPGTGEERIKLDDVVFGVFDQLVRRLPQVRSSRRGSQLQ